MRYLIYPSTVVTFNRSILYPHEPLDFRHGGESLLKQSLGRPLSTFGGTSFFPTVEERAGSLLHSLAINHPFQEGNKRTATAAVSLYLDSQGYRWTCTRMDVVSRVEQIVREGHDVHGVIEWVRSNVTYK